MDSEFELEGFWIQHATGVLYVRAWSRTDAIKQAKQRGYDVTDKPDAGAVLWGRLGQAI